ncbi:L-amino acid N-acyltransferase YncA [Povalibacter uvarum]|uniref:L-amino acid N-acyltransferase YncA n=1 Tax=Povalibacter uvarum TaxID=732238 RepID=A0A841HTJ4_9GAMM|nr:N-acetyltransferase [Povalibacter uvarum]MBB6095619.1 L-amino acid N-acyltransferase YncA [Povalibacter uvarum]
MALKRKKFKEINLADAFFDSLKADYKEFGEWFAKKGEHTAYVFHGEDEAIQAFLYLKVEEDALDDLTPGLPAARRLKVGTMKVNPHGTRMGERLVKKIFDHAVEENVSQMYVTIFPKHAALVALFRRYGFAKIADKHTANGSEDVLARNLNNESKDILYRYPSVSLSSPAYLLSLYPVWHTRLLPDSILKTEKAAIIEDVSHTNSIHKVYLAAMKGMDVLKAGDLLMIYRTNDGAGAAYYRSVATSICVVEEYRSIHSFRNENDFLSYCQSYSVFTDEELTSFWKYKKYPHVIRFTYNIAMPRRVTRGELIDSVGLDANAYWGFMPITGNQLRAIADLGEVNESLIVD